MMYINFYFLKKELINPPNIEKNPKTKIPLRSTNTPPIIPNI